MALYKGQTVRTWINFGLMLRKTQEMTGITAANAMLPEDYFRMRDALEEAGYAANTIVLFTDKLKCLLRALARHGYAISPDMRLMSALGEDSAAIALSEAEVLRLAQARMFGTMDLMRDRFVLGCVTGLRFSDYNRLNGRHVVKSNFVFTTMKTKTKVIIPLHQFAAAILKKYGGNIPEGPTNSMYNKALPIIAAKARINEIVKTERRLRGEIITETWLKHELVSTHTARRSFATNAYLAGIPAARIMLITGHKTEESFFRYIRLRKEENAALLAQHPFFR